MTLWNPTVQSVTSFVRVPVTNDYTIIDPMGQIVSSEVSLNEVDREMKMIHIFLASSYSNDDYKHSWKNKCCTESNFIQSHITSTWFQYLLFSNQK